MDHQRQYDHHLTIKKIIAKKSRLQKSKRPRKGLVKSSNRCLYLYVPDNPGAKAMPQSLTTSIGLPYERSGPSELPFSSKAINIGICICIGINSEKVATVKNHFTNKL